MVIEQSITAAGETDIVTSHNQGIITPYGGGKNKWFSGSSQVDRVLPQTSLW